MTDKTFHNCGSSVTLLHVPCTSHIKLRAPPWRYCAIPMPSWPCVGCSLSLGWTTSFCFPKLPGKSLQCFWKAFHDHHAHQDSCPAPCPTCPQTLTVGMSSHPQGGAAGAGQPGRVGRVGMGGRVPGQLAALQGGSPGDHEMGGQVPGTAAWWVDPGEFHKVLVVPVHHGGGLRLRTTSHPSPALPPHPVGSRSVPALVP